MTEEKDTSSSRSAWHGGKGSITRKGSDQKAYSDNWDKIFGNKDKKIKPKDEKNK